MVRDKLRHSCRILPRNLNILPQNLFFSPQNPWRFPMGNNGCIPVRFKFSVKGVTNGRLNYAKLRKNLKTFRSRVGKKCMFLHFVGCFAVFRAEIICKHCFLRGFRVVLCRVFRKFAPVLVWLQVALGQDAAGKQDGTHWGLGCFWATPGAFRALLLFLRIKTPAFHPKIRTGNLQYLYIPIILKLFETLCRSYSQKVSQPSAA